MKILVFIQNDNDTINPVSLESLQAAQKISEESNGLINAISFKSSVSEKLQSYDLNEIIQINNPELQEYNPLYYIKVLEELIQSESPNLIVFGHTYETRDWVPRVSARLNIPFISDCIGFDKKETLTFTRSIYQGKFNADVSPNSRQAIISFQSGAFRIDDIKTGSANTRSLSYDFTNITNTIKGDKKFQETESAVDLSQADIIVSVGRGIGKEENLPIATDLAKSLNAEIASSRPIVDSGWLEPYHQVGSSGQNVSPKLYFALGISGAIQHVVGMKSSKNIIVINKDKNAPIFEIADYGIVGDIFEIIPKLTEIIKNR